MRLEECVPKRMLKPLAKKKVFTADDYLRFVPRKYNDYTTIFHITEAPQDRMCVVEGKLMKVERRGEYGRVYLYAKLCDETISTQFCALWFGNYYAFDKIKLLEGEEVVILGQVKHEEPYGYSVVSPEGIYIKSSFKPRVSPVYSNIKGVSEEAFNRELTKLLKTVKDPIEQEIRNKAGVIGYREALYTLHHPKTMVEIEKAKERIDFNDLLYFSMSLNNGDGNKETNIRFTKYEKTIAFRNTLPFELTKDQLKAINRIACTKERLNLLVQGDVGCGKTIVAIMAMMMAAENGYQSVIMAPTKVLAKQHYIQMREYAKQEGYECVYLEAGMKAKEKKEAYAKIARGEANFIIGTHSCICEELEYKNLGIVIVDEEHKFGVEQKKRLSTMANNGVHSVSMTATPIPRSLASVIYGDAKEIVVIKTMPSGRKPIQTAICANKKTNFSFIEKQIAAGHQCYVVCPAIEESDAGLVSVEEVEKLYRAFFEPKGMRVGIVTGKMDKEETEEIIGQFSRNEISILISTTVIEVGVNVPNATVIVIEQAERFGLASLHQLRGRVGRSSLSSYCILSSPEKTNERLLTMTQTTDGFVIAEADLKMRGSGNLIGTKQSGYDKFVELMLLYPDLYQKTKELASLCKSKGYGKELVALYTEHEEALSN